MSEATSGESLALMRATAPPISSADLPDGLIFRNPVNPRAQKYFSLSETQITLMIRPVPRSLQRRFAVVTKRGAGCDGRYGARDECAGADGEGAWSWSPDAGIKPRGNEPQGDGGYQARHSGESAR
jgi:hypothetical protein